ncbi:MAG: glycoside hydrolase family 9 protein [Verrucomicrobia bacterium]|nr:glycoside hydrolase family 9 protein [Verrucomicrobiota bacterium]
MKYILSAVIGFLTLLFATRPGSAQEATWEYAVQVSATVQSAPPQIKLSWPQDTRATPNSYTIYRKAPNLTSWGTGTTLPGSTTSYTDSNVAVGTAYEYQIVKLTSLGYTGYGYIVAGIQAPLVDSRGKVVLVVDNTYAANLVTELARLEQDLAADGWTVLRRDVARTASPATVKGLIKTEYNADPANVKAVFLFGRVPVVRSGNLNVDGHQARPMPADVFYGDMDGNWTDGNGDGIYDQSYLPSDVDLQVGRVDFANMPGKKYWNDPGSFPSEVELLRRYLNKDHNFRHKLMTAPQRGLVGNRFGDFGGEAFAASGYRNFAPFFGAGNYITSNASDTAPLAEKWISYLQSNSYLWAYGCGGGSATSISGLGTNGLYSDVWSTDIVAADAKAVFHMYFGSWLCDWDTQDNIMRSALATPTMGLTCSWSGRPHHYYHAMALGETAGFGIRLSQNNNGLYKNQYNSEARGIHIALMGDPTLRMHPVAPPSALSGSLGSGGAQLTWLPSADSVLGYHVYRAGSQAGPFTRVTGSPVNGTSYTDATVTTGSYSYMVRAVKLENTPSGTYFNASQGAFATVNGSNPAPTLPVVTVQASDADAAEAAADAGIFTIARTDSTTSALTVNYSIGGSAQAGSDYATISTSVTLPIGAALTTVVVTPIDDAQVEGSETVTLTLASNSNYSIGSPNSASITIADNDSAAPPVTLPTVTVTASDANATEGSSDPGVFSFNRTGDTSSALTVNYGLNGTAIKWSDYRRLEGDMPVSIIIPAGASSATLTIYAFDDTEVEATETVVLSITPDPAYNAGTASSATVNIADNDSAIILPTITVATPDPNAAEAGLESGTFSISRSGSTATALTVNYSVTGSATSGSDYASLASSVTIPVGAASATVVVTPVDDTLVEGSEAVTLTVNASSAYTVAKSNSATVTIADNDSTPTPTLPAVTVTATDANATEGNSDPGVFTFTRTGDTSAALTVNYALDGTGIKWTDYRRLEGDMPISITLPAGAASATLTIFAYDDTIVEGVESVVLTLTSNSAYTVGSSSGATVNISDNDSATPPPPASTNAPPPTVSVVDYTNLEMPKPGAHALHILSPNSLELVLINTKQPDPARVESWDFVDSNFQFQTPSVQEFSVTVGGQSVAVQTVGFKRRALYAPLAQRDLRIQNSLYLRLAGTIADGQAVEVKNPSGALWQTDMQFVCAANPLRYSPAIHVNQEGYLPSLPKKASVGYYLGSLGEMDIPASLGFSLIDQSTGQEVFRGALEAKLDVGYAYTPTPYQKVLEADFSNFTTPGEYRLVVPGLGASLPFMIDDGVAMAFARSYALGLYHQRCGTNCVMPYTRHTHGPCHTAQAEVPVPQSSYEFTWSKIAQYNANYASNPRHTAPQLKDEASQLYPFVKTGKVDVSGGHHDAGDYSKYTINVAGLIHYLIFAADAFPGVAALDNLGLPESGDGISDLLQEAKWEADYLAKLQDADGGFYFIVYPRDRAYENNVLPDQGDPQVVWPKNTSGTAAAVAALAQTASSPLFKQHFPSEAAAYLQKAQLGWQFLINAIARYGKDGSYQKINHYGDEFMHDDELAWAACELYLATGDPAYQQKLFEWFPNPSDSATYRWSWWRLWEAYGRAVRSYAFAARTGRLESSQLNAAYLAKCEAELLAGAEDHCLRADSNAYGTSFPLETKRVQGAGWYFSSERAFDAASAYQLDSRQEFLDAILSNLNYEGGANPVNVTYVTGLGWKRQREIVHQYAQNDRRVLPPAGIPLGNIQAGFAWLTPYQGELGALNFPQDSASTAPYPYYDRWGDSFNVTTEFVDVDQSRSLASLAFLTTLTPAKSQAWTPINGQIVVPSESPINQPVTAMFSVPGVDLGGTRIIWEARGQEPAYGTSFTFTPTEYGANWIEAEAQWPDGRRVVATATVFATNGLPTVSVAATDGQASEAGPDPAVFTFTRAGSTDTAMTVNYVFSGTAIKWNDYRRLEGDIPVSIVIPAGAASATLTIYPVDDTETEGAETVILTLSPDAAYNVGAANSATVSIADNEGSSPTLPEVTVAASDPSASETALNPAAFTITRTGATTGALTVNYSLSGTASNGTDYNTVAASVTLPISVASATVIATPIDDSMVEGEESIILTITANAGYTVGSSGSATATLADNDASTPSTVTVMATDGSAAEAGVDPAVFTFTRSGDTTNPLTVSYGLAGTAIKWTDYRRLEGDMPVSITIPAGATSATLTIYPVDDTEFEGNETVIVTLGAEAAYAVGSPNSATATISDNDVYTPPTISVAATDSSASEAGPDPGVFAFTRTGDTSNAVTVNYALAGTAIKWTDYRRLEGDMPVSITIPAGATSATLTIYPFDDAEAEGNETVILTLQPDAAYEVGSTSSAGIMIADNDLASTVSVVANDASASRVGPDSGQFTFMRTGSTASALTVNYALDGTAIKWTDYRTPNGDMPVSIIIPASSSAATLTIVPQPSASLVNTQTVILALIADAAYTVGTPGSATINIAGNSVPILSTKATGSGVTLTWASQPGRIYRVAYKTSVNDASWIDLAGNITATGSKTSWTDRDANKFSQRVYVVYVIN